MNEVTMRELHKRIALKAMARSSQGTAYGLDESASEVRPPCRQVLSVLDLTEDALRRSGIARGMRVLDLGCGTGDTSLWIAKLVGPTGLIVGIDQSADAIDVAQRRATVTGQCYWAQFIAMDPAIFSPLESFDVAVVRLMLFRRRETDVIASRLSTYVRPGGLVILTPGIPTSGRSGRLLVEVG
jgi:2-polyprenyl-3-methyl-5-hydroxy-6-metoxy-1,4-benzoquinol methylase